MSSPASALHAHLTAPAVLETARLVLRRPEGGDVEAVFDYARDPEVSRYVTWRTHVSLDDARAFLLWCDGRWVTGAAYNWAITVRGDRRLLGTIELRPEGHRAEVGYVLGRSAWGRGYASEAARAVVDWALGQPALHRVWAVCDVENTRSARVLEKAGMTREGCLRGWAFMPAFGAPRDVWCYARVKGAT